MNDFVTSDIHFGHKGVIFHCERRPLCLDNPDYDPNKPYHPDENNRYMFAENAMERHDDAMAANWNSVVSKRDRVIIIGDFAWKVSAPAGARPGTYDFKIPTTYIRPDGQKWNLFARHKIVVARAAGDGAAIVPWLAVGSVGAVAGVGLYLILRS